MKKSLISVGLTLVCFMGPTKLAVSVEPDRFKDAACPEGWSESDAVIPVDSSAAIPWSDDENDKSSSKHRLAKDNVTETIDGVPVTGDDLVEDSLTVASNCLFWRNKVVDGEQYYPPAGPIEYRPKNGHLASSAL